ncbi:unnamed protein product, partial [Nesidiocoris tenuis]
MYLRLLEFYQSKPYDPILTCNKNNNCQTMQGAHKELDNASPFYDNQLTIVSRSEGCLKDRLTKDEVPSMVKRTEENSENRIVARRT